METEQKEKRPYKKKEASSVNNLGFLPPQDIETEKSIIGFLLNNKALSSIWSRLHPDFFYKEVHQKVFSVMKDLFDNKKPVEILSVQNALKKLGQLEQIGGFNALLDLEVRQSGNDEINEHIIIIHELFLKRELISLGQSAVQNMYTDTSDVFQQMAQMVTAIDNLKKGIFKRNEKQVRDLIAEAKAERSKPKKNGLLGSSTGKAGLDYITQGDQGNQFRIKAARPAMGKTADMCSEMVSCVWDYEKQNLKPYNDQTPVGCFSLEMTGVQLTFRMISNVSEVDNLKIKKNELDIYETTRVDDYEQRLSGARMVVDDTPGLTIDEFEAKAAIWVALYGIKKIYIDYIQLMKGTPGKKYGTRDLELADISRRLKVVAKELDITIIALCQLSRAVEGRKLCKPTMADLRETGAFEQDADVIEALWRPAYYENVMDELKGKGLYFPLFDVGITDLSDLLVTIVLKCREEETGMVPLKFKGKLMKTMDHYQTLDAIDKKKTNALVPTEPGF